MKCRARRAGTVMLVLISLVILASEEVEGSAIVQASWRSLLIQIVSMLGYFDKRVSTWPGRAERSVLSMA